MSLSEEFFSSLVSFRRVKKELLDIVKSYDKDIDYYNNSVPDINFYEYTDSIDITISFNTGSIPFGVIREVNEFMGFDCSKISSSVGHAIILHYVKYLEG